MVMISLLADVSGAASQSPYWGLDGEPGANQEPASCAGSRNRSCARSTRNRVAQARVARWSR